MSWRVYLWSRGLQVGFVDFDDQDKAQRFAEIVTQVNGLSAAEVIPFAGDVDADVQPMGFVPFRHHTYGESV